MKHFICLAVILSLLATPALIRAEDVAALDEIALSAAQSVNPQNEAYTIGVDDILEISVLQPDELLRIVNVAPDGTITFPYIGTIKVKDLTITQIQKEVQDALADGYMKYPVVVVSLQESR